MFVLSLSPAALHAQLVRDTSAGAPKINNINPLSIPLNNPNDVTNGLRYLLRDDDLIILNIQQQGFLSISNLDTSNSIPSEVNSTKLTGSNGGGKIFDPQLPEDHPAAQAAGRMWETSNDVIVAIDSEYSGGSTPSTPVWEFRIVNRAAVYSVDVTSEFHPHDALGTQVVMGDFKGDNLSEPLVFYLSDGKKKIEWGMKVFAPVDPLTVSSPKEGPELYGHTHPEPVTGTIVVGDFNGDGRDEIAALLSDYQTIAFYSVDPDTLTISQTNTFLLPQKLVVGQAALAAGKFRDLRTADLVAFGQIAGGKAGYTLFSIGIDYSKPTEPIKVVASMQFEDKHFANAALAQAASILSPAQSNNQQLVLGIATDPLPFEFSPGEGWPSFIEIGSFDNDLNFIRQSETKFTSGSTCGAEWLQGMQVGNFDNQVDGIHSANLQIETATVGSCGSLDQAIKIWDIDPPDPILTVTDWLRFRSGIALPGGGNLFGPTTMVLPADLQGRSLRLGPPEIVTIPQHIQPDIVLAMPPMHVDYVNPNTTELNQTVYPGCNEAPKPCELNLTAKPTKPPLGAEGFATTFNFSDTASNKSHRQSTSSFGVTLKTTEDGKVSYGNAISGGDVEIKNSTENVWDKNVKKTHDLYTGITESIAEQTGFADHLFYTVKDLLIYYYPVLAHTGSDDAPSYVEFSTPVGVTHADADATLQEWYQPVHEPGNVLSYPWSLAQLQNQFTNTVVPLTTEPSCQQTGGGTTTYTTTWTANSSNDTSTGATTSFSDDTSVSTTGRVGVKNSYGVSITVDVDTKESTSFQTLNETTATMDSSTGISVNKPSFGNGTDCCTYAFEAYIFGQKNETNPAYQTISVNNTGGSPAAIQAPGPLFVGFLADPLQGEPNGLSCGTGGSSNWWKGVYNTPDVALNHPQHWLSNSDSTVTFNKFDRTRTALGQGAYQMKGFFITKNGDSQGGNLNLSEATAGDQLTLTARVYNYSLIDTNNPQLPHPAASIQVRFYGQLFCSTGNNTENSCRGPNQQICQFATLCGDGFLIGQTALTTPIAGFHSSQGSNMGNTPNWALANVNFDTTKYSNSYMVFWVVVWMADANGNMVPEMPGHGLQADPRTLTFHQLTDVPLETYSNNVGMYGQYTQFFIFPPNSPSLAEANGSLSRLQVSGNGQMLLDHPTKLSTSLSSHNGPMQEVSVAYFDGDPGKDGKLLDLQKLASLNPGLTYHHQTAFQPKSCGVHTIYALAWAGDTPSIEDHFETEVTVDPVERVTALVQATKVTSMRDDLRKKLILQLETVLLEFRSGSQCEYASVVRSLDLYVNTLLEASHDEITPGQAKILISQAHMITECLRYNNLFSPANMTTCIHPISVGR